MAKKKTYDDEKYLGGLLKGASKLSKGLENKLSSAGLGFLADYFAKQRDYNTRSLNKTGLDDPMVIQILKDISRPARQMTYGLGKGAQAISPGPIGNWENLLDMEEMKALKEQPGKEIGKSALNLGGQFLTAGLSSALSPAISGIKSAVPRVLARAGSQLPGNLMQAYGMTEEYKGEDPGSAMLGAGIGTAVGAVAPELIQGIGRKAGKIAKDVESAGETTERGLKGIKTVKTTTGLSSSSSVFKQAEKTVKEITGDKKLTVQTVDKTGTTLNEKLSEIINSKAGERWDVDDIVKNAVRDLTPILPPDQAAGIEDRVRLQLNNILSKRGIPVTNGGIDVPALADLKRFLQSDAYKATEGSTTSIGVTMNKSLHDAIYERLRKGLGKEGSSIYGKLESLWQVAPDMMKNLDSGLMGTQYIIGFKVPGVGGVINTLGAGIGRKIRGLGKLGVGANEVIEGIGGALSNIPEAVTGVGSQVGRLLGGQQIPMEESTQPSQTFDIATGEIMDTQDEGQQTADLAALGGPTFDLASMGQETQGQGGGMQVDWEGLNMALVGAVLNGQITAGDAQAVLGMIQSIASGGTGVIGEGGGRQLPYTALGKIAEVREAQNLLPELTGLIEEAGDAFGPIKGNIRGRIPWDETGQSAVATIKLIKQIIGKGLEGGVLRKEDESKYEAILPKLGDPIGVVENKIKGLEETLGNKYFTLINAYEQGGYDVSQITAEDNLVSQYGL